MVPVITSESRFIAAHDPLLFQPLDDLRLLLGLDRRDTAGIAVEASGPEEEKLRRACGRLLHVGVALPELLRHCLGDWEHGAGAVYFYVSA